MLRCWEKQNGRGSNCALVRVEFWCALRRNSRFDSNLQLTRAERENRAGALPYVSGYRPSLMQDAEERLILVGVGNAFGLRGFTPVRSRKALPLESNDTRRLRPARGAISFSPALGDHAGGVDRTPRAISWKREAGAPAFWRL